MRMIDIIRHLKHLAVAIAIAAIPAVDAYANLIDAESQPATTNTFLGAIDMSAGTLGDLSQFIAPWYAIISNAAMNALSNSSSTNVIKDVVTNSVIVGYTSWTYSGDTSSGVTYSITSSSSGDDFIFTLWNELTGAQLGTTTTNVMNPTAISFSVTGGTIDATRDAIQRNANGIAMYSDVQQLSDKIDNMDTSYYRVVGITNKNQSVQYVYTDATVTELQIQMPESGMTKDWLVYVLAATNLTLKLPPANYWCTSYAVTNDIPFDQPTALYFSQINDDTYSIGRQELVPVTVYSPAVMLSQKIQERIRKRSKLLKAPATLKKIRDAKHLDNLSFR